MELVVEFFNWKFSIPEIGQKWVGEVVVGDILQVAGSSSSLPYCSLMIYHHLTLMIMMMPLSHDHGDKDGHCGDEDEDKIPLARKGWVIYWRWQEALMLYGCLPPTPHYWFSFNVCPAGQESTRDCSDTNGPPYCEAPPPCWWHRWSKESQVPIVTERWGDVVGWETFSDRLLSREISGGQQASSALLGITTTANLDQPGNQLDLEQGCRWSRNIIGARETRM